jgi:uncharacterized membrane protein
MSKLEWLKLIHVLAAILWVGGAMLVNIYGARFGMSDNREERLTFAKQGQMAGLIFSICGVIVLLFGIWMVADVPAWEFSHAWVSIGFLGVAVGAVLGMAFYGPQARKLIAALESGDNAADAIGRRIAMVATAETVLLIVVIWAMVAKPGL